MLAAVEMLQSRWLNDSLVEIYLPLLRDLTPKNILIILIYVSSHFSMACPVAIYVCCLRDCGIFSAHRQCFCSSELPEQRVCCNQMAVGVRMEAGLMGSHGGDVRNSVLTQQDADHQHCTFYTPV